MALAEEIHDGATGAQDLIIRMGGEDKDTLHFVLRLRDFRPRRDGVPPKEDLQYRMGQSGDEPER